MLRRFTFPLLALVTVALACGGPLAGNPTATVANTAPPTTAPTATPAPRTAQLNVSGSGAASSPRLAFDPQGSLHVVWEDRSARPSGDYFHRQLNPDGQWSETQNLTEGFELLFGSLSLLPGPDGRMCVVWNGALKGTETIGMYRRCQTDTGWSDAEIIVALGGTHRDFAVALTPDGTPVEIHIAGAGDVMFGDLKLTGEELSTLPSLAIDARGDLHAAWVSLGRQTGDPFSVVHRRTVVEGDGQQLWLDPETLSTAENQPDALGLKLVADAEGDVHIVWSSFDSRLYYRRWTLQGGWSDAVNIAPEANGASPDLAVDAEGRVRVAWARFFDGVYYTSQGAGGTWSEPSRVVSTPPEAEQGAEQAHLAVDAQGMSHIVWVMNGDVYYMTLP